MNAGSTFPFPASYLRSVNDDWFSVLQYEIASCGLDWEVDRLQFSVEAWWKKERLGSSEAPRDRGGGIFEILGLEGESSSVEDWLSKSEEAFLDASADAVPIAL